MKPNKQLQTDEAELQAIGFKICSMKLIQYVRRNEVLYNSDADGYTDKTQRDLNWEYVHKLLYPPYEGLNDHLKELIRNSVRRRWKTLRNAIAREVRRNATSETYCRKKESPIIAELEFLIPHIKSAHCAKLADELGLRESYQFMNDTNDHDNDDDNEDDDDENDDMHLIDLTRDYGVKPKVFKVERCDAADEDEDEQADDDTKSSSSKSMVVVSRDALYPTVQLATGTASINKSRQSKDNKLATNWSKEFCALAHYKGGEFTNVVDAMQDSSDDNGNTNTTNTTTTISNNTSDDQQAHTQPPPSKKSRISAANDDTHTAQESNNSIEWHARIAQLLNIERERNVAAAATAAAAVRFDLDQDEDRMFLLSLVSDLKRIPAAKRPFVKAEIATVIARGLN